MSLIVPYFISILISLPMLVNTPIPPDGWVQWVYEFPNKEICELALESREFEIYMAVSGQFRTIPHEIKELQCMTLEEGVQANKALGHKKSKWREMPIVPKTTVPRV